MTPLVEIEGASRRFGAGARTVTALDRLSLAIDPGEHVAIVGQSGSGKTSLVSLIGLLDRPSEGRVRFLGEDTGRLSSDRLARLRNRHIGFVFQAYHLLAHRTALENVELALLYRGTFAWRRRRLAAAVLERVGLGHRLHARPAALSGGEQQRVAIARALVGEPDLIIADEPTGALDTTTGGQILDLLDALNADGRTLVVVTHDPAVAARARRLVTLRDGRLCPAPRAAAA